ncbi:hypothetical protein E4K64_00230 [Bradyrhizobium frederickii]|uniref:Uncharacterized protein n=1 Tax=Bradyrhizobium frederickii TaxID=2560054 RepID=A0A4Y9PPC3_9BRAD|nr:hypothetical protein [Bradyrhizobium frederickii]TFV80303.1 hypothetical protein E4K64_00230 [Bradyrhizobium frederickii]
MTLIWQPGDVPFGTEASKPQTDYRRFAFAVLAFLLLPPVAFAGFTIAVDPYYIWGAPSWPGINVVRPAYEPKVVIAKPYQVARLHPSAVSLGSSRVEVGIDPRHKGWAPGTVFNFALPSSNSYAVMLAFLHAQKYGAPLKQAVVGLDFFAFNINFPLASTLQEQRFDEDAVREFAQYLDGALRDRPKSAVKPAATTGDWNETLYLAVNADVKAAVLRKEFKSGREHFELAGRTEGREGAAVPADWDEAGYLQVNPDVAAAVKDGPFVNGYHHWLAAGRVEGRLGGFRPANWDEARYLAANPFVRIRIARGEYRDGYLHYAATGRKQGLRGAIPPTNMLNSLMVRYPSLSEADYAARDRFSLLFTTTTLRDAIVTLRGQSEPATFDSLGMRVWHGQEAVLDRVGGATAVIHRLLKSWNPILVAPSMQYCFTNPETGMTTFDPFRFMIRKAYADGTDLRLFVTPLHAVVRATIEALGLGQRYAFWLHELVRINEEEASRAGRQPFPLWDFSAPNSITTEPIPKLGDRSPMRWFWERSHYRKQTGDLILDRIFDYSVPDRAIPADFGTRLTSANIDAHLTGAATSLANWSTESDLASQIAREAGKPGKFNRQSEATCW